MTDQRTIRRIEKANAKLKKALAKLERKQNYLSTVLYGPEHTLSTLKEQAERF